MADAAELPDGKTRFTYADYKAWELAPGERYELIYGVAYPISRPAYGMAGPNTYHQLILAEVFRQFADYLHGKPCRAIPAPFDVRLFYNEDENDDTVVQPDISVVCDKKKLGLEACRGAPDLVAEILSPSNTAIEMQRKFELYRRAGVREYWLIDPENKTLQVHCFEPEQTFTRSYGPADTAPADIFPGLEVTLETVFAE
jgi:Uma2 family endonuclease